MFVHSFTANLTFISFVEGEGRVEVGRGGR